MNIVRGVLAEYLVARAVGDEREFRHAWADYDVEAPIPGPASIKIEVKAGAFLQSWTQRNLSKIGFSGLWGYRWNEDAVKYESTVELLADVLVFAVQTSETHEAYDPIDLSLWQFYVMPAHPVRARNKPKDRLSLNWVKDHAGEPLAWEQLREAVEKAYARECEMRSR